MFSSIALPKVVADTEAGGGIPTALKGLNALSTQAMNNRLLGAQTALAQQQAKYTPYQYATQALSNPALWFTAEGRNAAKNIISQLPSLAQGATNQNPVNSDSLMSHILKKIGALTGEGQDHGNGSGTNNPLSRLPTGNVGGSSIPDTNVSGTPPTNNGTTYNTPANAAAAQNSQGMSTNPNPLQTQEAQAAAQKEGMVGQTANENKEINDININANKVSQAAVQLEKLAKGFGVAYDNSSYKGARAGAVNSKGFQAGYTRPGHDLSEEQIADNLVNNLQPVLNNIVDSGGNVTDTFRGMVSGLKFDRTLEPKAKKFAVESTIETAKRLQQLRPFVDLIRKNNPSITGEQIIGMLNQYNENAPPYDYATRTVHPENNKRLKEFTSKKALNEYIKNGEFNPDDKQPPKVQNAERKKANDDLIAEEIIMMDGKTYKKINGVWHQ
jgi:hypothetical protein